MRDGWDDTGVLMGDRFMLKSRLELVLGLVGVELSRCERAGLTVDICFTGVETFCSGKEPSETLKVYSSHYNN